RDHRQAAGERGLRRLALAAAKDLRRRHGGDGRIDERAQVRRQPPLLPPVAIEIQRPAPEPPRRGGGGGRRRRGGGRRRRGGDRRRRVGGRRCGRGRRGGGDRDDRGGGERAGGDLFEPGCRVGPGQRGEVDAFDGGGLVDRREVDVD